MAYLVYARRFRPKRFDEIVGQKGVVDTLTHAIAQDRVAHAYLFCGPRGTGKTTSARILARALNCEKGPAPDPCGECALCREVEPLDLVEMDAASHNGVDDIRSLREGAYNATHRARYRVYIIDEVHMLSTPAFNAFLKILEEPPPHVKFVLCTTDPQRIPETVRSRCQRLDFRRITAPDVVLRLRQIASGEKLDISDDALGEIARHAEGGLRDAEVLLEQLSVYTENAITIDDVRALTGAVDESKLAKLAASLAAGRAGEALEIADGILESGTATGELLDALVAHLRASLALQACGEDSPVVRSRGIDVEAARGTAGALTQEELLYAAAILQAARKEAKSSPQPRILLELALVRLSRIKDLVSLEELAASVGGSAPAHRPSREAATPTRLSAVAQAGGSPKSPPRRAPSEETSPFDVEESAPKDQSVPEKESAPEDAGESAPLPPAPPPAPEGSLTMENVSERWPFIQSAVSARKVSTGAFLKNGVLARVQDDALVVAFSARWAFHRERLADREPLLLVEAVASEILGRPVKVKLEAARKGAGGDRAVQLPPERSPAHRPDPAGGGAESSLSDTPDARAAADRDGLSDPRIRKLLDRMDGRIVHVGDDGE